MALIESSSPGERDFALRTGSVLVSNTTTFTPYGVRCRPASDRHPALVRRDRFDPMARVQLFAELSAHFRAKVEFPPEATDGVTDEQYVRNVLDVVYRTKTGKEEPRVAA